MDMGWSSTKKHAMTIRRGVGGIDQMDATYEVGAQRDQRATANDHLPQGTNDMIVDLEKIGITTARTATRNVTDEGRSRHKIELVTTLCFVPAGSGSRLLEFDDLS